jgi:hypothetical protein
MPPKYVKTIREEILYEYAKLMSRTVFRGKLNYGFITDRFKALRNSQITMSGTNREWQREQELPHECVFCGSREALQMDHLIPRNRGGSNSADNMVLSCRACNVSRGEKGIFEWLGLKDKDKLHRLVAGKYLKELYNLHVVAGTLDISSEEISQLCVRCKNRLTCVKWGKEQELTCFCLESIF